jgi:hypothetical protein
MVPVRGEVLVLAATLKATVPLPEPLDPLVTVIQLAESVAVHAQPLPAVTANDPVPPPAGAEWLDADRLKVHGAAAWVIVNVWVPTVMVPVRPDVFGFAATLKVTVPIPVPLAPFVMVIHAVLLVAVHEQLVPVVTLKDVVMPAAGTEAPGDPSVNVHVPPACVIVKVCPPTVMVPVRGEVVGFDATL